MKNIPADNRPSLRFGWCLLALLTVACWGPGTAGADRDADHRGRQDEGNHESDLRVAMEPLRAEYGVGEAIRLRARGNLPFFLYVYTVDDETGEAILLLPNKKDQDNQYAPGQTHTIPHPSTEFYSDGPGEERIIMVASRGHIDLNTARFRDMGDFSATTTKDLEQAFAAKGIQIRDQGNSRRQDVVVTNIELHIRKDVKHDTASTPQAVTFVSTDKTRYREGEQLRIVFGADRPGWVHLYTIEPSRTYTLLTRMQVDGKSLKQLNAGAESPTGAHALLAVYSEGQTLDETFLNELAAHADFGKCLSLVGDRGAMAARRFEVER